MTEYKIVDWLNLGSLLIAGFFGYFLPRFQDLVCLWRRERAERRALRVYCERQDREAGPHRRVQIGE